MGFVVGILETGRPPESLAGTFSSYPDMFAQLLGVHAPDDWDFQYFRALDGELPQSITACDAWLVTGSKFGAYEDLPWIHNLRDFLARAYQGGQPIVGICFGHQILAEALGGKVIKSDKGWGCGVHQYEWAENPDWMPDGGSGKPDFAIQAYHQDQVVDLPEDARVIARSEFCDYAALAYKDQALTFQGHPEFASDYSQALLQSRRGDTLPVDVADAALATMDDPLDSPAIGHGIVRFLQRHQAKKH